MSTDPNQYQYQEQPVAPAQALAPPAKPKRRWLTPVVGIAALALGLAVGASAQPEPEVIQAEPVVEVETITETVERTPQVCLEAIDSARAGFSVVVDVMDVTVPALEAAFYRDIAGMEAATADMEALNAEINSNNFATEAAACERLAR